METLDYPRRPVRWAHRAWERDRQIEAALTIDVWYQKVLARCVESNGCIVWDGPLKGGYGYVKLPASVAHDSSVGTHRVMWLAERGPLAFGWLPDHLCLNTRCCSIEHLEAVPCGENARRSTSIVGKWSKSTTCPAGHPRMDTGHERGRMCHECKRATSRLRGILINEYSKQAKQRKNDVRMSTDNLIMELGGLDTSAALLYRRARLSDLEAVASLSGGLTALAQRVLQT